MTEETAVENGGPVEQPGGGRRKGLIVFVVFLLLTISSVVWWLLGFDKITTDNAFVEAHMYTVSSRVAGRVDRVYVKDNQFVTKGELLYELEPENYKTRVEEASAALDIVRNEASGDYARVDQARAELEQSRARCAQSESDLRRGRALFAREVIPKEQLERLETVAKVSAVQVSEKEENLKRYQAEAGMAPTASRGAKEALHRARLDEAALHLGYAKVTAPADGYVTRKSIEPGNYVQTGQPALVLVSLDDSWVTANFKESQLEQLKVGHPVALHVDAYPSKRFTGTVESVMAGTGSAFSLLPPENATGNYVKVVQRVPVRIAIDHKSDPDHLLRAGMSVIPTVHTERSLRDLLIRLK